MSWILATNIFCDGLLSNNTRWDKKMKIKDALKCFIEYNLFFFVSLVVTHHYKKNCMFSKYYQLYKKYALNCWQESNSFHSWFISSWLHIWYCRMQLFIQFDISQGRDGYIKVSSKIMLNLFKFKLMFI